MLMQGVGMTMTRFMRGVALVGCLTIAGGVNAAPTQWPVSQGGNDHYYEFVAADRIDWESARDAAAARSFQGKQGYLATLTSEAERVFVVNRTGLFLVTFRRELWLGGSQASNAPTPRDGWSWVTGEPWQFTAWETAEPNDGADPVVGERGVEQYLGMFGNSPWPEKKGFWNDETPVNAVVIDGYVVEYGAVPEPTSSVALIWMGSLLLRRRR